MRKTICTASIFVAILTVGWAAWTVRMPNTTWWYGPDTPPTYWPDVPLLVWANNNIFTPAAILCLAGFLLFTLWKASEVLCDWLQSTSGGTTK